LENPFPGHGETQSDVCTDQQAIKQEFVSILHHFGPQAKRLCINGESGAGKTNILRYFERLTEEALRNRLIRNIYPVYVFAPGESYFDIHEQIVDKLSALFLGALFTALRSNPQLIDTLSTQIKSATELLATAKAVIRQGNIRFAPYEERQKDAFIRWLKGRKLSAGDKRLLEDVTPPSDISSTSLAIRFLDGFLQVLREMKLCDGIVLLFDEFEEIFEGLTRSRQSRYAQELRHLFDTLQESVLFIVATIPEPKDLAQYPAIERRLGNTLGLQPIDNVNLAITYVEEYLNDGREKFFSTQNRQPKPESLDDLKPLTREIIAEEYGSLKTEAKQAGLDVLPGYFLPRIRERMKNMVEGSG
jgi:hypothetical protein